MKSHALAVIDFIFSLPKALKHCRLPLPNTIRTHCLLPTAYCLLFASGCSSKDQKFQRYFVQGEELYVKHCSNCHNKNGRGLAMLIPPVDVSDYMDSNFNEVICLIEYGKSGELMVNGKSYNMAMPGIPSLTDLEIAEIATYLYNSWGRDRGMIDVRDVSKIINECKKN
jgi:cytochrome c551